MADRPVPVVYEYHRVLLEAVPEWIAKGWRPAVEQEGAIGAVPICGGTEAEALMVREIAEPPGARWRERRAARQSND